jgi:hypothetical protein
MCSLEDWSRVTLLDPVSVTFGLNPLALPEGITPQERVNVMQTQVEEVSLLLSDVFNTETDIGVGRKGFDHFTSRYFRTRPWPP